MGQTLPNGIYLPAEGERNCYDGLEGNWRSLDSLISTVAGKASATHTHGNITNDGKVGTDTNKPLITGTGGAVQAGSFGNQANTFCEGNDSRLSDARTPVAHTHTKSDVTDLFNSANTWTGVNTYTDNTTINKNSANPTTPDETSLAFIAGSNYIFFRTKGSSNFKSYNSFLWGGHQGSGYSGEDRLGHLKIYRASDIYGESGENTPDTSFSFIDIALHYKRVKITDNVSFKNDGTINACYPAYNNATDLGASTNKWKSFNGINPGALSLPGGYTSSVTEYITDKTGGANAYTAPADGWVGIQASSATFASENFIFMGRTSNGSNYYAQNASSPINAYWGNTYHGCILLPVISGKTYEVRCKCDSVDARFYTSIGNVV